MITVNTILQLFVAYYIVQIAIVNYHTLQLHREPPPAPPPAKTITVTENVDVEQVRDHLTQDQLKQIRKEIEEESLDSLVPDLSELKRQWSGVIEENMQMVDELVGKHRDILTQQDPLPAVEKEQTVLEPLPAAKLDALVSFLELSSFKTFSAEELDNFVSDAIEEMAESVGNYNFEALENIATSPERTCKEFLTRNIDTPVKQKYATMEAFEDFLNTEREKILSVKDEPLSAEAKATLVEKFTSQEQDGVAHALEESHNMIDDLEDFFDDLQDKAEGEEEENDDDDQDDCVQDSTVREFTNEGVIALIEQKNIYEALSKLVDGLDESIVLAGALQTEKPSEGNGDQSKVKTLKEMISLPIYPKFIESVDSSIEYIAGYSDIVDQVIDALGGNEEGGVGKNLERSLNKLAAKVKIPLEYDILRRKAGVTK